MKTPIRLALVAALVLAADWPAEPDPAPWATTELGVAVQDVVVGSGDPVMDRSAVDVHYVGMLANGTVFDTSRDREQTLQFRIGEGQVIRGWEDGLLGMQVGGIRRLVIPPELGYGDKAAGPIPSGSTLYFEVELVSLMPARQPPTSPSEAGEWRSVGGIEIADVAAGGGKKVSLKSGRRACLDHAVFDASGALVEHTWTRAACTWYVMGDDDLPPALEAGLRGMRAGGRRLVRDGDQLREVIVMNTGK